MSDIIAALKKFADGDGLNDHELGLLIDMFERMYNDTGQVADHYDSGFGMVHREVRRNLQTLEDFQRARERNKS